MAPRRLCSECGGPLSGGVQQKTCSDSCRKKRSKRMRRESKEHAEGGIPANQEIAARLSGEMDDLAHDVIADELRPVIREALTEETLQALQKMIGLTPRVVEAITEDLNSEDHVLRQRAYTLIAKYTIGHPALVRPEEEAAGKQVVVNFGLPRADVEPVVNVEEVDEIWQCDRCGEDKPSDQFVSGSRRCVKCFSELQAKAQEMIGDKSN